MGCPKLYNNFTDLKISYVSNCVRSKKSKKTLRRDYLFGFNGQEKDNEIKGNGNSLDFGARVYDSRLGRFLSIDPLAKEFPNQSSYMSAGNNPIIYIDEEGKKKTIYLKLISDKGSTLIKITRNGEFKAVEPYRSDHFTKYYDSKQNITLDLRKSNKGPVLTVGEVKTTGKEVGLIDRTLEKVGLDNVKLPQVMVFGSAKDMNQYLDNPKADPNRPVHTINFKEAQELFDLILLSREHLGKEAKLEIPDDLVKKGMEVQEKIVEVAEDVAGENQEGTGHCRNCGGYFENGIPSTPKPNGTKDTITVDEHK